MFSHKIRGNPLAKMEGDILPMTIFINLASSLCMGQLNTTLSIPGARCNARPVATGLVICVCDWLRDETGLDFCDRSWICNATLYCHHTYHTAVVLSPGTRELEPPVTDPGTRDHVPHRRRNNGQCCRTQSMMLWNGTHCKV